MPYTYDSPPTWVKNLPKGAQRLCVDGFNDAHAAGKSDTEARMACWGRVKSKYRQQGDRWVRKEQDMDTDWDVVGLDDEGVRCEAAAWSKVDKSKLPKSAFAYTPTDNRSDWKLPYKTADGKIHCGGVHAARAAIKGARSGKPMNIPASAKAKIDRAAKACGFDQDKKEDDMDKEVLTETYYTTVTLSEEDKNERGYHTARLLLSRGDYVNQNNRVYPMSVWEREVPRAQNKITNGSFIGLADHPGPFQGPSILNTVIKFESVSIEGKEVWGDVIFIPTSKGRDVIEIAKAGVRIGASTRGGGTGKVVDEYTDFEGVIHKNVMVVQDDYEWKAADLVVEGSVEGSGVYHFEHRTQEQIDQLQELLYDSIEEMVSEPLNAKIAELENAVAKAVELNEALSAECDKLHEEHTGLEERARGLEEERDGLATDLVDANEAIQSLTTENEEIRGSLSLHTDRVVAMEHLFDRARSEQFAMLMIEELKGCKNTDEVDEKWESAQKTVESLVANRSLPGGRAAIDGLDDSDDKDEDKKDSEYHHFLEKQSGFSA